MPNKSSTTKAPPAPPITCNICGKKVTKGATIKAGMGSRCAHIAQQYTPAQLAQHYKKLSVASMPKGFIKLAVLDKKVKAQKHNVAGLTITKMVNAIGKDRANKPPAHPIAQPYYLPNRHRVVNAWLATPAGLKAIATGNFSGAPTPPKVSTI